GLPMHDPDREQAIIESIIERNPGPFDDRTIVRLFREILNASLGHMERTGQDGMLVARAPGAQDVRFSVRGWQIGAEPVVVAGPCAVESEDQMHEVAAGLARLGVGLLRGGAFKPRTSPYSFQGLGVEGLKILRSAADRHAMAVVTEVMDPRNVEVVARYADVLQIGARNMYNYDLLREAGRARRPVFLKRAMSATLDELMWAAEYVALSGEDRIILCDRGVRTFTRETRNSLDIAAVPLLRRKTALPIAVDVSHAAGRRDILVPLARAALAAGAQMLMVEVHPRPAAARSDASQQLSVEEFEAMLEDLAAAGLLGPAVRNQDDRVEVRT
ncbi:MAG: bifunctional 3-deoxy-7-phosphoheptulonate synthase/chorismate mutase, partial [Deltaproteobacteria bacterium]|nr:bifunctional 3-deoxy-7-phosphoheptulonate synthase/chorismate mutase [Deltaproteobacteria bacterium]